MYLAAADPVETFQGATIQTDTHILKWIGESVTTVYHAACTCKMESKSDTLTTVDSNTFVYGTSNFRVVCASAFPLLPPGHPQNAVYAFAEKTTDAIITGYT